MPLWLQIAVGILAIGSSIVGFGVAIGYISYFIIRAQILEATSKVEKRINRIEESLKKNVMPFIRLLEQKSLNPLTPAENKRKNELLKALEIRELKIDEAKELQTLLRKELEEAQNKGDTAIVIAIIAVLLLLAFILSKE